MKKIIRSGFNFLLINVWSWGGASAITVGIMVAALIQSRIRPPAYVRPAPLPHYYSLSSLDQSWCDQPANRVFRGQGHVFTEPLEQGEENLSADQLEQGTEQTMENILSQHYAIQNSNPREEIMSRIAWRFPTPEEAGRFLDSLINIEWLNKVNQRDLVDYLIRRHNGYLVECNPARFTCLKMPDNFLRIPSLSSAPDNFEPMKLTRLPNEFNARLRYSPPLLVTEAEPIYDLVKLVESQLTQMRDISVVHYKAREELNNYVAQMSFHNDVCLDLRTKPWRYDFFAYNSLDYANVSPEQFKEAKVELSKAIIRWADLNSARDQFITDWAKNIEEKYLLKRDGASSPSNDTDEGRMKKTFILMAGLASGNLGFRHAYMNHRARAHINVPAQQQLEIRDQRQMENEVQQAIALRIGGNEDRHNENLAYRNQQNNGREIV